MDQLRTLRLQFDEGRTLPVEIRRETTERSAHTGRELIELHAWATAEDPESHRVLSELLPQVGDRPICAVDETSEFAGKWCISWNSYAESGGVHTYALLLREAEELSLVALEVEGLELHPYEYREEEVGSGLTIRAKVVGSEDDVLRLRSLMRARSTLRVVRRGIQDEPREMRLGVAEWSQYEDSIKYRLVLMDRELDTEALSELGRIEEERNHAALGFYANLVDRLTDLLVEKGVLSPEELQSLRDAARDAPGVTTHEMWRVADVDEL